jgi:hypothetical protein
MKEYSSLLAVPLQKYVMCGGVLQCRRGWKRAAPLLQCSSAGITLLYAQNMRQQKIPVALAPAARACW